MKHKFSIIYSWFIRTITFFLPNIPIIMRFRGLLYSILMKECGENFQVTATAYINSLSEIKVGNNIYLGPNTVIICRKLEIQDNVLIGPNCILSGGNHVFDGESFRFSSSVQGKIIIGAGSWIGGNCSLLANSFLPNKSILAAGAVLNKKFDKHNCLYGGVPAKLLKKIN